MLQAASTGEAKHRVVIIIYKLYEIMEKEDLVDCIPYYSFPRLKCVDIPKDGKSNRRERRRQELRKRKGRL